MNYSVISKEEKTMIASQGRVASGFFCRLLGLMFRKKMKKEEALIFYRASSIHTFFMRFSIDIIFLDRQMKVKRLVYNLKPWRAVFCRGAYVAIELPAGKIDQSNVSLGSKIWIQETAIE